MSIVARFKSSVCNESGWANFSLQKCHPPTNPKRPLALQNYLELLRLPNVFTAVADVAMGFFFVIGIVDQAAWAFSDDGQQSLLPIAMWTIGLLAAASALLYSAGMVLNDVFDIELDREEQPYRPLPSGRILLSSARWLGWQLLTLGIMLASGAAVMLGRFPPAHTENFVLAWRPAIVAAALAVLIVLYNAGLKRTPLGPVAMGGCRTLNVLMGMSVLRGPWQVEHWAVAAGIGVYIAGVTWFARNDARRSDRRQLISATLVMLAGVGLVGGLPWLSDKLWMLLQPQPELWRWYTIIALLAGFVLAAVVFRRLPSRRPDRSARRSAVRSRPSSFSTRPPVTPGPDRSMRSSSPCS